MKRYLEKLTNKIIAPIANNFSFFCLSFILLFIPSFIRDYSDVMYWIMAIPIALGWAYILSGIVAITKITIVKYSLYIILFTVTTVESFLIVSFGTRFSALIIRLWFETNRSEAIGFFTQYVLPNMHFIIMVVIAFIVLVYLVERYFKLSLLNCSLGVKLTISCFLVCLLSLIAVRDIREIRLLRRNDNIAQIFQSRLDFVYGGLYTSYGLLIDAINSWIITSKDIDELAQTLQMPITTMPTNKSIHVCLIIGESFNKHHASIYNYFLNTTPNLKREKEQGSLYVFNNVITPVNTTIKAMQLFSSFSNQDNGVKWSQTPLLPRLYKLSGYYSCFISNSEAKLSEESIFDTKNNYWVSSKTAPLMFDTQNSITYKYDHELLNELERANPVGASKSFTMIHLLGQHSDYADRYPKEYATFFASDYTNSKYGVVQREGIAHYDNATIYNDYVVNQIIEYYRGHDAIIVYFSDHGEEVYDYRDFIGRSHESTVTANRAKYQFEIPFVIWVSDEYKQSHPQIIAQIEKSIDRPYMIDDLPHTMLDLAGIEYDLFDPTRSLINEKFNNNRKRLLLDTYQDYDEIIGRKE